MAEYQTIKDRLGFFLNSQGIKVSTFEKTCGLSNGYLRQLRKSPTADKVEIMLSAFPQLSRTWLLTGEGDMLTPHTVTATDHSAASVNGNATAGDSENVARLIVELSAQREAYTRQIDRLIGLLERGQGASLT